MSDRLRQTGGEFWAITSYFNRVRYRRRLENYQIFRERLGLPLLTVELDYGPRPELGPSDADIMVQLRGHDVMWQKERLLNLAWRGCLSSDAAAARARPAVGRTRRRPTNAERR